jgi:hypothetical protein
LTDYWVKQSVLNAPGFEVVAAGAKLATTG